MQTMYESDRRITVEQFITGIQPQYSRVDINSKEAIVSVPGKIKTTSVPTVQYTTKKEVLYFLLDDEKRYHVLHPSPQPTSVHLFLGDYITGTAGKNSSK